MIEMIKKLSNYLYFLDGYDSGIGRRGRELREEAQSLLEANGVTRKGGG